MVAFPWTLLQAIQILLVAASNEPSLAGSSWKAQTSGDSVAVASLRKTKRHATRSFAPCGNTSLTQVLLSNLLVGIYAPIEG